MSSILVLEDIQKSFGRLMAVADVSFEVEEEEIFGIAGPNGAGKTTLFNVISGIPFHPDSGRIYFQEKQIQSTPAHVICHMGIARTFQRETVFETLSVLENVWVGAAYGHNGEGRSQRHQRAGDVLEFVGLTKDLDREAGQLALFDKKLLMLASALVTRPKVLLLDEPAAGLSKAEIEQSAELFRSIQSQGIAIVLIEHVLPLLLSISDRVMILNEGQKLIEGLPGEVVKDERVIKAYLGGSE